MVVSKPMVGVLILTHGCLGRELLAAAREISGSLEQVEALCLKWDDVFEDAYAKAEAALEGLDRGQGVLILTDIYGGTPARIATRLREGGRVEVIAGVNLPMVVRVGCMIEPAEDLASFAQLVFEKGCSSIRMIRDAESHSTEGRGS